MSENSAAGLQFGVFRRGEFNVTPNVSRGMVVCVVLGVRAGGVVLGVVRVCAWEHDRTMYSQGCGQGCG